VFHSLLRQHRLAAGLTQEALAERSATSVRAVQNLERGDRRPQAETTLRLANALGLQGSLRSEFDAAARPRPRVRHATALPQISPNNLPDPLTDCIGRASDVARIRGLLDSSRLVTLLGPGGAGKTRLALELGWQLARAGQPFADGVWLVELDSVSQPCLVPQAVAAALGVCEEPGRTPTATLCAAIGTRAMLLVLDNVEHVVESTFALVEALLRRCSALRILLTSRQPLGVPCERTYAVSSLTLPPRDALPETLTGYAAVQLFLERAQGAAPEAHIPDSAVPTVAAVCRSLDGIPLALELAAARLRGLSLHDLADRLEEPLEVLDAPSHRPSHQRSLREAIDWSYALLDAPQRRLLCRMSIFSGGWTLEAAEAIAGKGCALALSQLVDHSLVQVEREAAAIAIACSKRSASTLRNACCAVTTPSLPAKRTVRISGIWSRGHAVDWRHAASSTGSLDWMPSCRIFASPCSRQSRCPL
jgi:predicted ATPase/DNA-binding XRE family transcriptional regulator